MFDTIKGGDYLVDQDAAEILAREAIETVIELEHMGLPFNRTPDGQDRPAAVRRPHPQLRGGARPPVVLRGRPDRAHDPPDAVPAGDQARRHVLRRVPRRRPHRRRRRARVGRSGRRRRGVPDRRRRAPHAPRQVGAAGDRRVRADVPHHLERVVADRRRRRARVPPRHPAPGHGVLPVPPDRDRRDRHPAVGGGPRRGRHPAQRRGRAVHAALRPDDDGPGAARHGQPGDLPGGPGRPRHRRQGLRLPRPPASRPEEDRREAAGHHRVRARLPGHRARLRADPDPADRALRDGRHPDRPA